MTALVRPSPPSSGQLLGRVLAQPALVEAVQHLPASALAKLIEHVGLEDAGELIALATTAQLADVFDHDLWRGRPGQAEALDPARFAVWLEVMVEAGAGFAARRLAELPEDLLTHLIHQRALVLELDQLERELAELGDDADYVEKACDDRLHVELDVYRLVARGADGWDALAAVLVALDEEHHDLLARVLERCAYLARRDVVDDGGLTAALSAEASLADDVAGEREDRRAADGYVEPRAAAGFLRLAASEGADAVRAAGRDPTTRAYFRELAPRPVPRPSAAADALVALLVANGVLDEGARALPLLPGGDDGGPAATLRAALADLDDAALHQRRIAELVYLANVLTAGAAVDGRTFRRGEAVTAAVTACGLGLAHLVATTGEDAAAIVRRDGADLLFRIGWHQLSADGRDPVRALLGGAPRDRP